MAAQSLLAKLGMRLGILGTASSLGFAFPVANGDPSMAAHTDATRIGLYADRTGGAEKVGHVVMGTEVLSVGVSAITAAVKVQTVISTTAGAGLNLPQGAAPTSPVNGDVWTTSSGMFVQIAGTTVGPFAAGGGTVSSVGLSLPAIFTVSGSPVTSTGTLTAVLATQAANVVWAGPATGAAAAPTFRALVAADLPAGTGTVTSVGLSLPAIITVTGSPVTGAGTLTGTLATQTANFVWAGPTTGAATAPTFRALVAADLPGGTGTVSSVSLALPSSILTVSGSPVTTTGTLTGTLATQTANFVWAGPTTGAATTPTFRALVAADLPGGTGNLSGTLVSGRVPFANGTNSLTDNAAMTYSTGSGFNVNRASGTSSQTLMLGNNSGNTTMTGANNILIGQSSGNLITSGNGNVSIGSGSGGALLGGASNTLVGTTTGQTLDTGSGNILLGVLSDVDTGARSNALVAGSSSWNITDLWFGNGILNASAVGYTIHGTGGTGANKIGGAITLAGGIGTGTGVGGAIVLQTALAGTTGSTPNTLTTRHSVLQDGGVDWTGLATTSAPALSAANHGTIYYDSTLQSFMVSTNTGAYAGLGTGNLSGSLTSGRVPFASGASTLTDSAQMAFSTANGFTVNRPNTTGTECFGKAAGNTTMSGANNTLVGASVGTALTSGGLNTAVGFDALLTATTDTQMTAIGYQALKFANTTSVGSTAVGVNACGSLTTAGGCVAVGASALFVWDTNGGNSTAVGFAALRGSGTIGNNTGSANSAFGFQALNGMTSGANNVALGVNAGQTITTGSFNIFLGSTAGDSTSNTASNRLVVGSNVASITSAWFGNGETNTAPASVVFHATGGTGANVAGGSLTVTGGIGTGTGAGGAIVLQTAPVTTSSSTPNTLTNRLTIGGDGGVQWTGIATTSAPATSGANNGTIYYDSTLQLFQASLNNGAYATFGAGNLTGSLTSGRVPFASATTTLTDSSTLTFSTASSLSCNTNGTSGCENIGSGASNSTASGADTTCLGNAAGHTLTSGSANTFVGRLAGTSTLTNTSCTYVGAYAGQLMRGGRNVAIGYQALLGSGPAASDTGANNVVIGGAAMNGSTSASSNVVIGDAAGQSLGTGGNNVMIGAGSGTNTSNGTGNIFLGSAAGDGTAAGASNRFVAGSATAAISNAFFGNGETNSTPAQCDIRGTGGLGTDVNGAGLSIDGGASTGAGVGGSVFIRTTKASGSSTTLNTLNTCLTVDQKGNIVPGSAALNTTATDGFTYVETCAGTPSGVPTAFTGRAAMVYDSTNNKLYVYNSGWKGVVLS